MPKNQLTIVGAFTVLATVFAVYSWAVLGTGPKPDEGSGFVVIESEKQHLVTSEMLAATEKVARTTAPAFRAEATDGKTYDLAELTRKGPVVLAFIKEGCPCSIESQPYFNRLFEAYGAKVPFFGVIDGPVNRAGKWGRVNHAAFPILSDVDLTIIHDYKAESSAYLALVSQGGTIEKLWPGYSVEMLNEVSARLAKFAGMDVQPIDTTGAPQGEMLTGCPF
ncbi:peroxiredoxin family protein [Paludisphaera borealis]|uniref:Thiol-disulfide oxidoreductase ResA n=1 Tax=Paludisphaera borealis TaxID=1387353 RepID=A0A1U7CVD6_9BACT|nr:redoxin domain-containing protein [Paludisphaera borealis]APW62843.1 Thiol-disulfide oxidoreductase ResA [Paludisphaera borealis]